MHRFLIFIVCLFASFAALSGCGGSGDLGDSDNPNGAFRMSASPTSDGESLMDLALEISSTDGVIEEGVCRFVTTAFTGDATTKVTGFTENGHFSAVAEFKSFNIEIEGDFEALSWQGTYQVVDGLKVLEQGNLDIVRDDATPSFVGLWEGQLDFDGKVVDAEFEIDQKGNFIIAEGTIGGSFYVTFDLGSVVGRSIFFVAVLDSSSYVFIGTINGDGDRITGEGSNGTPFTFEFDKVVN